MPGAGRIVAHARINYKLSDCATSAIDVLRLMTADMQSEAPPTMRGPCINQHFQLAESGKSLIPHTISVLRLCLQKDYLRYKYRCWVIHRSGGPASMLPTSRLVSLA